MLRRLWLSTAWVAAVVGALLGAGGTYLKIKSTDTELFDKELDAVLIEPEKDQAPSSACWRTVYGTLTITGIQQPGPDGAQKIEPSDCLASLKVQSEELEFRKRWLWAGFAAALTLWPALVYGIYRWGLWLVGAKRDNAAVV